MTITNRTALGLERELETSIRFACMKRDFQRLLSIERSAFTDPLDDVDLLKLMAPPSTTFVIEHCQTVAGFLTFRPDPPAETINVFNMAVVVGMRGRGLGSKLLYHLRHVARTQFAHWDSRSITLAVPERSLDVQLWLKGMEFTCGTTVRGIEPDGSDRFIFRWEV